jgi:hypothetical protein
VSVGVVIAIALAPALTLALFLVPLTEFFSEPFLKDLDLIWRDDLGK